MKPARYDVAVVGLGGMGSAALARCALRHASVVGVEQFDPVHALGASTGESRIIRKAYFEDTAYVPLLLRAYELWRDVERRTDTQLMRLTGLLMAGSQTSEVVTGSLAAARQHDLAVDYMSAEQTRKRFPPILMRDDEVAVFEPDGGVVFPEAAIKAHLEIAKQNGADMRFNVTVESWEPKGDGVTLDLSDGSRILADSLILTIGPWFERTFAALGVPLQVQRNVQLWFAPSTNAYAADNFPAFLIDRIGHPVLYGFPDLGNGVKAAFHGHGQITSPQQLEREIDPKNDVAPVARALEQWMPGASATFLRAKVCMYSLTPDKHFIIDVHPEHCNIVICGGFSGHGFKFASVVGEIAAGLALDRATPHDIGFLSLDRFKPAVQA